MKNLSLVHAALLSLSTTLLVLPGAHAQEPLWESSAAEGGGALKVWAIGKGDPAIATETKISVEILALHAADKAAGSDPDFVVPEELGETYDQRNIRMFVLRNQINVPDDGMITWEYFSEIGKRHGGFKPLTLEDLRFNLRAAQQEYARDTVQTVSSPTVPTSPTASAEGEEIVLGDRALIGSGVRKDHGYGNRTEREASEARRPAGRFVSLNGGLRDNRLADAGPPLNGGNADTRTSSEVRRERYVTQADLRALEGRVESRVLDAKQHNADAERRMDRFESEFQRELEAARAADDELRNELAILGNASETNSDAIKALSGSIREVKRDVESLQSQIPEIQRAATSAEEALEAARGDSPTVEARFAKVEAEATGSSRITTRFFLTLGVPILIALVFLFLVYRLMTRSRATNSRL